MFGFAVEGVATFPAAFSFSTGAKSICCAVVSSLSCNARGREIVRFDGNDVCLAACKVAFLLQLCSGLCRVCDNYESSSAVQQAPRDRVQWAGKCRWNGRTGRGSRPSLPCL